MTARAWHVWILPAGMTIPDKLCRLIGWQLEEEAQ